MRWSFISTEPASSPRKDRKIIPPFVSMHVFYPCCFPFLRMDAADGDGGRCFFFADQGKRRSWLLVSVG